MTLVVGAVGAFLACAVGGLVGFASSLLLLPVLLFLGVPLWEAVGLNLTLAVLTRLPSLIALRASVNLRRTGLMVLGSVPGIALGLGIGGLVPVAGLEVAAGVLVLASGAFLALAPAPSEAYAAVRHRSVLLAGGCAGVLGVTTSLNGVPPAVLLARTGEQVRTRLADLSAFFIVGNCLTMAAIAMTRDLPLLQGSVTTTTWIAAGIAGNAVGVWGAGRIGEGAFSRLTIWLVLASGCGSLVSAAIKLATG